MAIEMASRSSTANRISKDEADKREPWVQKQMIALFAIWIPAGYELIMFCELLTILSNLALSSGMLTEYPVVQSTASHVLSTLTTDPFGAASIRFTPSFLIGTIFLVLGGLIRLKCYQTLGKHFTFHLHISPDHTLITSGPYSIVRHPSYTGFILFLIGIILANASHGSWVMESGVLNLNFGARNLADGTTSQERLVKIIVSLIIKLDIILWVSVVIIAYWGMVERLTIEEDMLKEKFGEEWVDWARRVRYKLVPGVY
ncbi:hypothetical protein AX16_003812 [Volvariella volvacea WC 439]|nr:hypothetical protein AX16_003812 [Volvariella volvacea WC 439]